MRIDRRESSAARAHRLQADLTAAASVDGVEGRVCSKDCVIICPHCGSTACQCACSADCPEASQTISPDADLPVEPAVTPLVYEMKRLGLFAPCWSCEGHLGPVGELWKLPRVWFYCDSTTHVRLLADGLKDLEIAGVLSARWQVVVTFSDADNPETTFSLEPAASSDNKLELSILQKDLQTIASSLEKMMNQQASKLQQMTDGRRDKCC